VSLLFCDGADRLTDVAIFVVAPVAVVAVEVEVVGIVGVVLVGRGTPVIAIRACIAE